MAQASVDCGVIAGSPEPFYTQERCYITELLNNPGSPAGSLAECRVKAGVTTQLHSLKVEERYVVREGRGLMELGSTDTWTVGPGDVVVIPAGVAQRIENLEGSDLVFLCVCTPRFEPEHYVDLETDATQPLSGE